MQCSTFAHQYIFMCFDITLIVMVVTESINLFLLFPCSMPGSQQRLTSASFVISPGCDRALSDQFTWMCLAELENQVAVTYLILFLSMQAS